MILIIINTYEAPTLDLMRSEGTIENVTIILCVAWAAKFIGSLYIIAMSDDEDDDNPVDETANSSQKYSGKYEPTAMCDAMPATALCDDESTAICIDDGTSVFNNSNGGDNSGTCSLGCMTCGVCTTSFVSFEICNDAVDTITCGVCKNA